MAQTDGAFSMGLGSDCFLILGAESEASIQFVWASYCQSIYAIRLDTLLTETSVNMLLFGLESGRNLLSLNHLKNAGNLSNNKIQSTQKSIFQLQSALRCTINFPMYSKQIRVLKTFEKLIDIGMKQ